MCGDACFLPSAYQFHDGEYSISPVDSILNIIKTGVYQHHIRSLPDPSIDKKRYQSAKTKLPAWAFNGTFKGDIENDNFLDSSGLFHIDIDNIVDMEATKERIIYCIPELYALWASPSGKGLKGLIRIPDDFIHNDAEFKIMFYAIESYLAGFGIVIDSKCKDVRRLCFVCSDPDIYISRESPPFVCDLTIPEPVIIPPLPIVKTTIHHADRYISRCVNIIASAVEGNKHDARLRAGKLAGGYIAGGLVDENAIIAALFEASRLACSHPNDEAIMKKENKAVMDGIDKGKLSPLSGDDPNYYRNDAVYVPEMPEYMDEPDEDDDNEAEEWHEAKSDDIDYIIPFNGVARDIQQWIIANSAKPQPAIAFAATMTVLSIAIGRNIRVGNIKGNLLTICMAESGEGKDWPLKAVKAILSEVGLGHCCHGKPASGAALNEMIEESNGNAALLIDEFGHFLEGVNNKYASSYAREIMPIITECYTSGTDEYVGKKTKGVDPVRIIEPNMSVLGFATERQVMDSLRIRDVEDGSLARFMVLFGLNNVSLNHDFDRSEVPQHIIDGLTALMTRWEMKKIMTRSGMAIMKSAPLALSKPYKAAQTKLFDDMNDMGIQAGQQSGDMRIFKPFYYRLAVRSLQMALLIDQCNDVDVLAWCANIALKSCDKFADKFVQLSADNEHERFVKKIELIIKQSGKSGITRSCLHERTRDINSMVKRNILDDLGKSNKIFTKYVSIKGSKRPTELFYWKKG